MRLGTLEAIWRYPVKSLAGDALDHVRVERDGIPGDRASQLIVRAGHTRIGKAYRGKENNRLHLTHDTSEALRTANERGVSVHVDTGERHYFDAAEISLILDTWLRGVSAHVGRDVEYLRYRPNLFVRAVPGSDDDERAFVGRDLQLGEALLRVTQPIKRCVTTTYDLHTGESDPEILRYVAQERDNEMGVYCEVLRAGVVRIGDSLELLER